MDAPVTGDPPDLSLRIITNAEDFPPHFTQDNFVHVLHEHLGRYGDTGVEIQQSVDYAFSEDAGKGGFLVVAFDGEKPLGGAVINNTGMGGYIPEHILVYIAVDSSARGRGIGTRLIDKVREVCSGDIALHVEHENPAKRLYERIGFTSAYAEMRLKNQ